ncbi:helix-turn-helix transcriptional regulator [Puniceicoccales bacterium CK1056]|uniref:Helix-turn-helix transcriptional regulator n=1 Tax=Oceanipulchritudo coccoides TaxID=2706888 RepID=A0A6B2M114_9BACT|nr:metalloregulator ArsR/SmtB family transcription factor [Oceanipulchritudo coccoides]NDV61794.1 helix-turn-helix transcriptional regulator [Oceanipulchritudo coccoides]
MLNSIGQELREEFARNEEVCRHVIGIFQLIANKQRFRIVCILSRGDFCVSEMAEILGTEKLSNLSQQLKILRLAGIVECDRDAKRMVYRLTDDRVREMIQFFKAKYL